MFAWKIKFSPWRFFWGCTKEPDLTTINITHTEPTVHLLLFKVFVEIGENFSAPSLTATHVKLFSLFTLICVNDRMLITLHLFIIFLTFWKSRSCGNISIKNAVKLRTRQINDVLNCIIQNSN